MDMVRMLVDAAEADVLLAAASDIYGYVQPEDAVPPFVVITTPQATPTARPTSRWWGTIAVLNVHSEDPAESQAIADLLVEFVPTIVGIHDECVVQDSQVETVQPVTDDGWTPTRYRQVVTVDLTAREP